MKITNDKSVPTLAVTFKKTSVKKKTFRITALVFASAFFVFLLSDLDSKVQLFYTGGSISRWSDVFLYLLLAFILLFAAASLICEIAGYTKSNFIAAAASTSILLWALSSWWNYYTSLSPDITILKWCLNNAPMYLIAFAAVFLLGKFVLFKAPCEE